jgi:hypothetical protein
MVKFLSSFHHKITFEAFLITTPALLLNTVRELIKLA